MLPIALNHMTVPSQSSPALFALAQSLGCTGVELRNDLSAPLFDGEPPETIKHLAQSHGLSIHALSEVKAFNTPSPEMLPAALHLMDAAAACGARAITLIPRVGGPLPDPAQTRQDLGTALSLLAPHLERHGLVGLVEPIGFHTSTLRHKSDVVAVIEALGLTGRVQLVHDTFHHHLAQGGPIYADHTGLVHVSGVIDTEIPDAAMTDAHRVLVGADDRLGNLEQIRALLADGYDGPISMEAFSPDVHRMTDPKASLSRSFNFISTECAAMAA